MPRDRATLRTDLWADSDWRNLTPGAQWLYQYLLASPSLNYVGVADWRPKRIALLSKGLKAEQVERYGTELADARFVILDEESEEAMVRSFLRHDGVLTNPNLWKSVSKDFAGVTSERLKRAVAVEMGRLRDEYPAGMGKANPWQSPDLRTVLKTRSDTPSETPSDTPSPRGSDTGSDTSTATTTATEASLPGEERKRETRLPSSWVPTAAHYERAKERGIDIADEVENFKLHAETHDRLAANWNGAFTTWLKKAKPTPIQDIPRQKHQFVAYEDDMEEYRARNSG